MFNLFGDSFAWRRVTLELCEPYFLLYSEINERGIWLGQTEILGSLDDVLNLCGSIRVSNSVRIKQVALLSPSWMNKTPAWELHWIWQIRTATIVNSDVRIHIFTSRDGHKFANGHVEFQDQDLRDIQLVYSSDWHPAETCVNEISSSAS